MRLGKIVRCVVISAVFSFVCKAAECAAEGIIYPYFFPEKGGKKRKKAAAPKKR